MTYLVADDLPSAPAGERFRALLARPGILQMPGAHNGQAGLQAKAAGFDALYLSGAAMTASMGIPDVGMITVDEVCFFIRQIARATGLPLLANMTEFGRTPFFTASEFEAMGYKMVIWPVSSLRIANKAQAELYKAIKRDGGTQNMVDRMQTRAELYATIGYHDYEALDASIVTTIVPQAMPQRS